MNTLYHYQARDMAQWGRVLVHKQEGLRPRSWYTCKRWAGPEDQDIYNEIVSSIM